MTMDLSFTAPEEAFRDEVREFLRTQLPPRLRDQVRMYRPLTREDMALWHSLVNRRGWLAGHWPKEHGGQDWTPVQSFIFDVECALAHAPRIVPFGVNMLGPVLIKFGTERQKRHWLPRILDGSDWWCQGYSEPGAGSDLAAIATKAERRGDRYVLNGQKTWTTLGQYANMMFALVRTDWQARKQDGISFLLIDMQSPGVELRPIRLLDGGVEVNEVFLTDVEVPIENLVGEENRGWACAKYLLTYERTNIAGTGFSLAALAQLKELAAKTTRHGRTLADDPLFAARIARVEIDLENMRITNLRVLAAVERGGAPGAESSMLKIRGTQLRQELASLYRRALGPRARPVIVHDTDGAGLGLPGPSPATARYFNSRKLSIFGGSNEIQKNIIARTILGL
jgi:alkylation response protein AidB-like acyl-CoA dehydrogenase